MTRREEALIAMLLGDAPRTRVLRRWLMTEGGRREAAAYGRVFDAVDGLRSAPAARRLIFWNAIDAPIGRVLVAVGDAGLVRVGLRSGEAAFVADLERRFGCDAVRSAARTADVAWQLRAYFGGTLHAFAIPVDLAGATRFQRRVLTATAAIPSGRVVSYGDIARRIGRPGGSRAVGQALGRNPVPIVIPCHRVVAAGGRDGRLHRWPRHQRALLRIEGALAWVG